MDQYGFKVKEYFDPKWFAKEFTESVRIAVTFNRQMTKSIFDMDPKLDLHSRLLYSYVV